MLSSTSLGDERANRSKRSKQYNDNHQTFTLDFKQKTRVVPTKFEQKLREVVNDISSHFDKNDLTTMITHKVANPVLQLLVGVENVGQELINRILTDFTEEQVKSILFKNTVGSHLMEKIIASASESQLRSIFKDYIKDDLIELCKDDKANYVVQHFIHNVKSEKHFKSVIKILNDSISNFLFGYPNRTGIVVKMVTSAVRFGVEQDTLAKTIFDAFEFELATDKVDVASCMLHLKRATSADAQYQPFKPKVPGSLLIQGLLGFESNLVMKLIDSIATLSPTLLVQWAKDSIASRILDSFLSITTIPNASQRQLIDSGFGLLVELGCDGTGSHFVDNCWKASNLTTKEKIATELSSNKQKLAANYFGKFLLRNCNIDLFNRRREDWMEMYKKKKSKKVKVDNEIDELFSKAGK